jgi:ATP adenylyltransferase
MGGACPFCDDPAIRERTIVRDQLVWVFPTNMPIVPGHLLIAPVRRVPTFHDLTSDEKKALLKTMDTLMRALEKSFSAEGFNIAWNQGEVAGQTVPHIHVHLLPRKEGDTGITHYDPRKFLYRTGSGEVSPENELLGVAWVVREALGR